MQVMKSCSVLEEAIVHSYEEHSQAIEEKLQENFAALERISKPSIIWIVQYLPLISSISLIKGLKYLSKQNAGPIIFDPIQYLLA